MNFLPFLLFSLIAAEDLTKCFKRISRRAIDNYAPLALYSNSAITECMEHCITAAGNGQNGGSICGSFTFDHEKRLCKIYDHDGHKVPAVIYPVIGVDFFRRTADDASCAGPMVGRRINKNFALLRPRGQIERDIIGKPVEDTSITRSILSQSAFASENSLERSQSETSTTSVLMSVSEKKCDGAIGYYVVIGNEIVLPVKGGEVKVYNNVQQGDCATYCSNNKGPDGLEISCQSLNYFPLTKKCELYEILAEPHGTGTLLENEDVIYAEKFCIPENSQKCQNDEIFILHSQKTISSRPLETATANSVTECLELCLANGKCASAVLHSASSTCQTFTKKATEKEYIRDADVTTVLIENGCMKRSPRTETRRTSEETNESNWSACTFKVNGRMVKVRTNENGAIETRTC